MKTLKFKSSYSRKDIELLYQSCLLHSRVDTEFGMFCLGGAISLRSVFKHLQTAERYSLVNMETVKLEVATVVLLDAFDGSKSDLAIAEMGEISNKNLSEAIRISAVAMRKKRDEQGR